MAGVRLMTPASRPRGRSLSVGGHRQMPSLARHFGILGEGNTLAIGQRCAAEDRGR